tara:strand:- start:8187 stop:8390 length:204 start_codon:yes stop_codon:yes gene_type:complete
MNTAELKERGFKIDNDNITHHPSNYKNCPQCMDLWIERENKKATCKCPVKLKHAHGYQCPECYKITK